MDPWIIMLFIAAFTGMMGWPISSLFVNSVLFYCDWQDGVENDWGSNVFWLLMYPAAVTYSVMVIAVLYLC
ncbi:MAG: hypothetical protein K8F91_26755 [Candidatus Obscuribacterales bacterium]|nr:hypothetical protein [Candidatus Obscuribacterales bacterium]